jgi:hypothetical protein
VVSGSLLGHFQVILVSFRGHFMCFLSFRVHCCVIPGSLLDHFDVVAGSFRGHSGIILGSHGGIPG